MMDIKLFIFWFTLFVCQKTYSNIYPENYSKLNQTQIMFELEEISAANYYEITIFDIQQINYPIKKIRTYSLASLVNDGIVFNKSYSWNYSAYNKKEEIFKSENFYFETVLDKKFNTKYLNIEISKTNKQKGSEAIFIDGIGAAINYNGDVIWKLKNDSFFELNSKKQFRNIEINNQGNITTLVQDKFYELNLNGNILRKTINKSYFSNDTVEYYHHDAKRLKNGDFLLCSYRFENEICFHNPLKKCIVKYGSLIQLDAGNKLVWSWCEKGNVSNIDTYKNIDSNNLKIAGNHLNGFDINNNQNLLILSFRDNNRLILVNKKNGKILLELKQGLDKNLNFYGQHSPKFIDDSTFIFYNNNLQTSTNKESIFNAGVIKIKFDKKNNYKKIWEYEYNNNKYAQGTTGKEGYVQFLPNKNYLIGIGGHNNIIEVTENKEIVWQANLTGRTLKDTIWQEISSYRNHFYSSLYPRYFTVQSKLIQNKIKINNDGSEDDEYEVYVEIKKKNKLIKSIKIKSGNSFIMPLNINSKYKQIIIKPKAVEGIYREIDL